MEMIRKLGWLAVASRLKRLGDCLIQDVRLVYQEAGQAFEPRWFLVFYQLSQASPMSITAIAESVGISHPAVNQLAAEMESAGLLTSGPDARDGRKRCLALTPRGKQVAESLQPVWKDIETVTREMIEEAGIDLPEVLAAIESAMEKKGLRARIQEKKELRRNDSVRRGVYRHAKSRCQCTDCLAAGCFHRVPESARQVGRRR